MTRISAPRARRRTLGRILLGSSEQGLAPAEAARRLALHGSNVLTRARRRSPWQLLAQQFGNALVLILLVATALSAALGHGVEAIAITVIVLFAVLLGFVQEFRAERALQALQAMSSPRATVLRAGAEAQIAAAELVPGDILMLRAGDRIAADARLLLAAELATIEAPLTGESTPVDKTVAAMAAAAPSVPAVPLAEQACMVFAGTAVARGRGRAVVTATGMATEFGRIAGLLETVEEGRTPLQIDLDRLGRQLARAALVLVVLVVGFGLARGQPFVEMLVFGVALAVAVVPEALPAVVTISLALGVQRLARRGALMRRLAAVETLGSTSVICTDKTGTLTRDEMTAREVWVAGRQIGVAGAGYAPSGGFTADGVALAPDHALRRLLTAAALCGDSDIVQHEDDGRWHAQGDPTEAALVVAAAKAGLRKPLLEAEWPRVAERPFSAEARCMATVHAGPQGAFACVKGAPEVVLAACTRLQTADGTVALTAAQAAAVRAAAQAMAQRALRVLAIARREQATAANALQELTLLGLVGLMDPPRPEARAAIAACRSAGIRVVMITGDHPMTAAAIAHELGLLTADASGAAPAAGGVLASAAPAAAGVLNGAAIDALDDAGFGAAVRHTAVYARVSPAHKLRVVRALQAQGAVVAMTGDGVNDAPALKQADIGVAMGVAGTDVAREAAAMTLTDDNFATIVAAVEEGRGIYANIRKYLLFLLSSNAGEIGLMTAAALAGLPLPLTAVQLLYVNLATDGLPALALAVDPAERGLMRRAPRDPRAGVFTPRVVALLAVAGAWAAAANLAVFAGALAAGYDTAHAMTLCFATLVLIQFCNAYNFRRTDGSALRAPWSNRWLNAAIAWEVALLAVVVHTDWLQPAFGTVDLAWHDWALAAAAAATIVPVMEVAKWLLRPRPPLPGRRAAAVEE
ncbi:MAG: cation-translocating P-type ATPase [Burkholderiaceae bacterium]|nr:cation-translocating P-type ATPase [Burkholderiaceae bacterium]